MYFGGVAFKYQRHVEDLDTACRIAARYMDVVTTSGPGTGRGRHQQNLADEMVLDNKPLAIASGITPENVGTYQPMPTASSSRRELAIVLMSLTLYGFSH